MEFTYNVKYDFELILYNRKNENIKLYQLVKMIVHEHEIIF